MGDGAHKGEGDGSGTKLKYGAESSGGAYPNPHEGQKKKTKSKWQGGQSIQGYHGPQQLRPDELEPGGNPNAGSQG